MSTTALWRILLTLPKLTEINKGIEERCLYNDWLGCIVSAGLSEARDHLMVIESSFAADAQRGGGGAGRLSSSYAFIFRGIRLFSQENVDRHFCKSDICEDIPHPNELFYFSVGSLTGEG